MVLVLIFESDKTGRDDRKLKELIQYYLDDILHTLFLEERWINCGFIIYHNLEVPVVYFP